MEEQDEEYTEGYNQGIGLSGFGDGIFEIAMEGMAFSLDFANGLRQGRAAAMSEGREEVKDLGEKMADKGGERDDAESRRLAMEEIRNQGKREIAIDR